MGSEEFGMAPNSLRYEVSFVPAERSVKGPLRQTTLFGFGQRSLPKLAKAATEPESAASASSSASKSASNIRRVHGSGSKKKRKSKAGDEDRAETDVVLSIKPEFTKLISERKKKHEYRKYGLKDSVVRLWLYETPPTSAITYVMQTTRPKVPGEVNDSTGIGNDDFDAGLKQSKYGCPVTGLYRLKTPLTTPELKERFEIAVPQGWRYATKRLVEEVMLEDMEK
ncbi:hypothetical protein OH77DRAFT_1419678, partial [Trametes cingulata]